MKKKITQIQKLKDRELPGKYFDGAYYPQIEPPSNREINEKLDELIDVINQLNIRMFNFENGEWIKSPNLPKKGKK